MYLVLFQQLLLNGLITDFVGAIENQSADVIVFNEQARKNVAGSIVFPDQATGVAEVDGIGELGPIGQGTYTVVADGETRDASVFGYELGGPGAPTSVSEGRLPESDLEAVASKADRGAGFGIGDEIEVRPGGSALTVVGLADDARWSVSPTIFVSYASFEALQLANEPDASVLPAVLGAVPAAHVSADELAARITAEVDGVEALTRQQAVDESPGVEGVRSSFSIVLLLAFVVITLVIGFFFLILTVQKARPLTLLRAIGAPRGYLVRNLVAQVLLVLAGGIVVALLLLWLTVSAATVGDLSIELDTASLTATLVAVVALALLASLAAVRRVLRIEPIRATTDQGAL